jgi:hypothetical protein
MLYCPNHFPQQAARHPIIHELSINPFDLQELQVHIFGFKLCLSTSGSWILTISHFGIPRSQPPIMSRRDAVQFEPCSGSKKNYSIHSIHLIRAT